MIPKLAFNVPPGTEIQHQLIIPGTSHTSRLVIPGVIRFPENLKLGWYVIRRVRKIPLIKLSCLKLTTIKTHSCIYRFEIFLLGGDNISCWNYGRLGISSHRKPRVQLFIHAIIRRMVLLVIIQCMETVNLLYELRFGFGKMTYGNNNSFVVILKKGNWWYSKRNYLSTCVCRIW